MEKLNAFAGRLQALEQKMNSMEAINSTSVTEIADPFTQNSCRMDTSPTASLGQIKRTQRSEINARRPSAPLRSTQRINNRGGKTNASYVDVLADAIFNPATNSNLVTTTISAATQNSTTSSSSTRAGSSNRALPPANWYRCRIGPQNGKYQSIQNLTGKPRFGIFKL